jgi:pyruvate-formate lyase-activating enzyme
VRPCVNLVTYNSLEPAIDPNNRISFLLDWELTLKCNLDCSYCGSGHDNSTSHPTLDRCLEAIDFMFEYVDLYMAIRPQGLKYVVLNVYGGESLYHPDIITVLEQVRERYQPYKDRWHLTITTTTNAIVSARQLAKIIPLIDEFTVSYHTEATDKQKQQFCDNLITIRDAGRRQKCIVLMHHNPDLFEDANRMIEWLEQNHINYLPKQLDGPHNYPQEQVVWFDQLNHSKTYGKTINQTSSRRACCGGRQLCQDQNYKERHHYAVNQFPDWYCSVNHFFLYIKQVTGEVFVNKDCKMNFEGRVGPIGHLGNTETMLSKLKMQLDNQTLPIIQCKKSKCICGLCAPKAQDLETYHYIMKKYQKGVTQ